MTEHVMIDLETLGTGHDAVILSIGAVKFDPEGNTIGERFHCGIDPESAVRFGQKMDPKTVMWWMGFERDAARARLMTMQKLDLPTVLEGFQMWYGMKSLPTWGNGATFDNVILRHAYTLLELPCPWGFWDDRCYRTIKNLRPDIPMQRVGTLHDALEDAVSQAIHLQQLMSGLAGEQPPVYDPAVPA